jgi:hypothetical protein
MTELGSKMMCLPERKKEDRDRRRTRRPKGRLVKKPLNGRSDDGVTVDTFVSLTM